MPSIDRHGRLVLAFSSNSLSKIVSLQHRRSPWCRNSQRTFRFIAGDEMFSICPSFRHSFWKDRQTRASVISASWRIGVSPWRIACSVNGKSTPQDFDPSKELLGLEVDSRPRNVTLPAETERSWFGPNGQYIRELPCPSCRGRGYTPCPECGVDRSRPDCSQCTGKGVKTCWQCLGECVIWEESYDERPWEKARSRKEIIEKQQVIINSSGRTNHCLVNSFTRLLCYCR